MASLPGSASPANPSRAGDPLRGAPEHLTVVIAHTDTELRYTWIYASPPLFRAEGCIGKRDEETTGFPGVLSPVETKRQVLASGISMRQRVEFLLDGVSHFFDVSVEPLTGEDQTIIGLKTVALDVTEYVNTERALAESEERYRLAALATNEIVYDWNLLNGHITWNQAIEAQLGWEVAHRGTTITWWEEQIHPDDRDAVTNSLRSFLDGNEFHWTAEYRFRRADASYAILFERGYLLRRRDGTPCRMVGAIEDLTETREAEQAVQESQEDLNRAQQIARLGSWRIDRRNQLVRWSNEMYRLLGLPQYVIPDLETFLNMVHPEDRDYVFRNWTAVQDGPPIEIEYRIIVNGEMRWIRSWTQVELQEEGNLVSGFGTLQDITEQKKTEERIRESEARLNRVQQIAHLGGWELDQDTQTLTWSEEVYQILGVDSLVFTPSYPAFLELVHPDDRMLVDTTFTGSILEGKDTYEIEHRIIRPSNGEIRYLWEKCEHLRDPSGRIYRSVGMVLDTTERKRVEQALRQSELRLRRLLESSPIGTIIGDTSGRILEANQAYLDIIGLSRSDVVLGRARWDTVTAPEYRERDRECIQEAYEHGVSRVYEKEYLRSDGNRVPVLVACALLDRPEEELAAFVVDITDRKQVETEIRKAKEEAEKAMRAAEEANQMKSVFLANMSHEIRTPLTAILGFADVLTEQLADRQKLFAERIAVSSKRLAETLESVLTLARLEAGRIELDLQELDVAAEVLEVAAIYRPEVQNKGLGLRLHVEPAASGAHALLDRGALTSILQNLIGNAIKYTPAGTITIHVGTEMRTEVRDGSPEQKHAKRRDVVVHVEDTGIGIAPDFLPYLFEPFHQESTGLARKYQGSGLGLAVTRQLVEKMIGSIEVESRKDRGSRFTVRFPVAEDVTPRVTPEQMTAGADTFSDRRILIVEDDESARLLIEMVLGKVCPVYAVATAEGAVQKALEVLERDGRPVDLVLVDINLGAGPDGRFVLNELRRHEAYDRVPIIAITAYALPGDRDRFLRDGFDDYIRKPFNAEELTGIVTRQLARTAST